MKIRFLFWTGTQAHNVPVRDVLTFNNEYEELFEEWRQLYKSAVAEAMAEVLEEAFD